MGLVRQQSQISRVILIIYLLAFLPGPSAWAQGNRRLGVVDIVTDGVSKKEKRQLLAIMRSRLSEQRVLVVVRGSEINSLLTQENSLRGEVEALLVEHQNRLAEIRKSIDEGWRFYRASQFEEAITVLENAFLSLNDAALEIEFSYPQEILTLLAACHFFMGSEDGAELYLNGLLDLNASTFIDSQKFPPPIVDLFNRAKNQSRYVWKVAPIESDLGGVSAKLFGRKLRVQGGGVLVPKGHSIWGKGAVVFEKEGYAPLLYAVDSVPTQLDFQSLRDRRRSTRGLFAPIPDFVTAPLELKALMKDMNLSVALLALATKDLTGQWVIKGQWLDGRTSVSSPVVEKSGPQMKRTAHAMLRDLLRFISPKGEVLQDLNLASSEVGHPFEELDQSPPEFYQTWWFWTLVGVGVAGAGTGAYLLMKPSEKLKFSVQEAN